jgi:hypothetical protein
VDVVRVGAGAARGAAAAGAGALIDVEDPPAGGSVETATG